MSLQTGTRYETVIAQMAESLVAGAAGEGLVIVVIDGIPAGGKSSLTRALSAHLSHQRVPNVVIENDWFIARSIRNPMKLAAGLALALTARGGERAQRELLHRFLDNERLSNFHRQLEEAAIQLALGRPASLAPHGAFWNLRQAPNWRESSAAGAVELVPGSLVLIEGTLSRASYIERFSALRSVFVQVQPETARQRFLERNQDPKRARNLAFSALASSALPFRLAAEMISRNRALYDYEVDLEALDRPAIRRPQRAG